MAENKQRNAGIDLLRIVSMLMIVALHVLGHGKLWDTAEMFTLKGEAVWFLEMLCFGAVNIYALISGYVGVGAGHRLKNIISLWLKVVFYVLTFNILGMIFWGVERSVWTIIGSFFPAFNGAYWYYTAYFCLFFFMPILNFAINNAPQKVIKSTIIAIVVFFCVFNIFLSFNIFNF